MTLFYLYTGQDSAALALTNTNQTIHFLLLELAYLSNLLVLF